MFKKYFTPYEATQRLPLVKKIVGEILEKGKALQGAVGDIGENDKVPPQCLDLKEEIEVLISELEDLGCFYKDFNFEIGLVDFPAIIYGEEVFLCWKSDEEELKWYHSIEEGFPGRQPIPEELLISEEP